MPVFKLGRLGNEFVVTWTDDAGRHRVRTGTGNPTDAEAFRQRLVREQTRPKEITVGELLDWRIGTLAGRASHPVAVHQAKPLRRAFGLMRPMMLTREVQERYVKDRAALGRAPATIRSELMFLGTALEAGVNERLLAERPHVFTPPDSPPRDRYLTREEARKLLAACPTYHVRLFIELAIATGARMTAILELTWARVDFDRGQIDLRKNRFVRMKGRAIVPMTDRIRTLLSEARDLALTDHVVEHGGAALTRINKGVKAAGIRAGMPWFSAHVLRHTAAVWAAEDGHSMAEIAAMLGHKDSRTTERIYARYSPQHLRKVARALEF